MYLKEKEKKRYKNPHYIPHKHTLPNTKSPILTLPLTQNLLPPMSTTTLISKLLHLFVTSDKG